MSKNNEITKFEAVELGLSVSGLLYKDKPVFFAVELAEALGYADPHQALKYNCKSLIKLNSVQCTELGLGMRPKGIILATEADAYRLIMRSELPSAERVQDWVCEEVLPTLREHGTYSMKKHKDYGSGLPEYRKAKAMQLAMEIARETFGWATDLSPASRQCIIAGLINPLAGSEVIPVPVLTEHHYTATEVGDMFGVSANKIGRIANTNNLKTEEYGITILDKSAHSSKQVESFRYNANGVEKIREIIIAEREAKSIGGVQ